MGRNGNATRKLTCGLLAVAAGTLWAIVEKSSVVFDLVSN
jgi:hypothetical protein